MKKHLKILLAFILSVALVVTHIPIITAEDILGTVSENASEQEIVTQETKENENAYILGELKDKRSKDTKHFRMSDGSIKACIYPQNVHYLKSGKYEDIDNTLVLDEEAGVYKNKANSAKIALPESFADGYVEYATDDNFVKFKLVGSTNKKLKKAEAKQTKSNDVTVLDKVNSRASYGAVKTNIDIQYDIIGDKLKETIVINKKTKETFIFEILTSAYNAVLNNDNSVSFFDEKGTQIFRVESPYMTDSAGEFTNSVKTELVKKDSTYYLTYTPDYEWLSDKSRVYPVNLDPTVNGPYSSIDVIDTYVSSGNSANTIYGGADNISVGVKSNGTIMRGYYKLDIPDEIKSTDRIVYAQLKLLRHNSTAYPTTTGIRVDLYELTGGFTEGNTTWNNQPDFDDENAIIIDYNNLTVYGNESDNMGIFDIYDVTKVISKWQTGSPNYGIMLKLHDESKPSSNKVANYCSREARPDGHYARFLEIDYRDTTGLEDYWTYTSLPAGRYGTAYVNNYSGNLVVTQPDYGIDGNRMPISISHIYNTHNDVVNTYGGKWRLNYQMCIKMDHGNDGWMLYDADGTQHFFPFEGLNTMYDEDGLGYTINYSPTSTNEYVITDKNKNKMYFNTNGNLTKLSDAVGNTATITYDSSGNISVITDGANRRYIFAYTSGKLSSITAPDGKIVSYSYNSSNQLSEIIYPDGQKTTFTYYDGYLCSVSKTNKILDIINYEQNNVQMLVLMDKDYALIQRYRFEYYYNTTMLYEHIGSGTAIYQYQFDTFGHTSGIVNYQGDQAQHYVYNGVSVGGKSNKIASESKIQKSVVNLLPNHRLDDGPYTINKYESLGQTVIYNYTRDYDYITDGAYNILRTDVSDSEDQYAFMYYDYIVEKTGYYTFSAYVSTNGVELSGNGAVVRIERIKDGINLGGVERGENHTDASKWNRLSVTYYFEEGDTARCLMGMSDSVTLGNVWFDELQLEEGETANSYNILALTNFSDGTGGWPPPGNMSAYNITESNAPQSASKGVAFTGTHERNYTFQYAYAAGNAGDVFSVGAWAKANSVPTNTAKDAPSTDRLFGISVHFSTDQGTKIERIPFNNFCEDWQFVSAQVIAPTDYSGVYVYLDYQNNANTAVFTLPYLYKEDYGQTYTYDDDGNVISSVDLAASETNFAYNDNQLAKIFSPSGTNYSYTYDETNNLLKYAISSDGIMEEFTYDSAGNALSATTWSMPIASTLETGKTYYIVNAKTRTTLTAMGEAIRAQIQGQSFKKNDKHQKWTLTATSDGYYNIDAYLGSSNTNFRLDVPNGADTNNLGMIIHNPNTSSAQKYQITQNADGTFTIYTRASNFTKCLDALSDNTSGAEDGIQVVQSTYSADDKAQKWYFYEADSVTDGEFIKSTAEYTGNKNYIFKTTDAFGNVTQYNYDTTSGLLLWVIDPEGNKTEYTYNTDNSIDTITAVNGNLSTTVDYTYLNDLLTQIKVLNGTVYNFVYDTFGRTDEIKVGTALLSDIVYNSNGTINEMRYGNGKYISYEYDDMYRTTKKIFNGDNSKRVEYYYNASGNLGVVIDYITNETTRYIYDLSSRLVEVEVFGTASLSATNLVKSIKYTYADKTNYLTEVEYDSPLGTQSYNYNYGNMADGEMPDAVYSVDYNGTTQLEYTYDDFGRLTERNIAPINKTQTFTYKQGGYGENSTSALVETVTVDGNTTEYLYDNNGNIYAIKVNGGLKVLYRYNSQNELGEYNGADGLISYYYRNGNITRVEREFETIKTFRYTDPNWPDKLTHYNGIQIYYDAIGNPQSYYDWKQFSWANGRQLVEILEQENLYQYTYDGDNIRTSKTVNGTTTQFIYADGVLLGQKTGNNTLLFLYDESGGKFGFIYNGAYYYYDINLQGDVVGIYNSNGVKVVTYEYDPWGVITDITDTSGINIGTINPIRYRGYYYDNETGFYYLQSRYYDPNICRFINADGQIAGVGGNVLGYNQFAYCFNNPVNMSDETGNWPKWVTGTLNIIGGVAQFAAGAALGATVGWTGVGAVAAGLLLVNGTATATQGVAQIVNHVTKSNTLPEVNIARTAVEESGRVIGGDTGAKVAGTVYDATVFAASVYAGVATKTPTACFVAGTSILTSLGVKAIEEIRSGDFVWAKNTQTGEVSLKPVVQTFVRESSNLVYVHVNGEKIITTPEHPFYVPSKGWISAINLRAGDVLQLVNGQIVIVEAVQHEILETPVLVYNFEVEDFHTYYVGKSSVLVHNTCGGKPTSPNQMQQQVIRGQAPIGVDAVHVPHVPGQQPHIHFTDGTSMNIDGSIHDKMNGIPNITNKIAIWLNENNWGK